MWSHIQSWVANCALKATTLFRGLYLGGRYNEATVGGRRDPTETLSLILKRFEHRHVHTAWSQLPFWRCELVATDITILRLPPRGGAAVLL